MDFLEQLKQLGYIVHYIFECTFKNLKKENAELKIFLDTLPKPYKPCEDIKCEEDVLRAVRQKKFRGFLRADVTVPKHMRQFYSGFELIFKKTKSTTF